MDFFKQLKKTYPDLVETWIAQEVWPSILPQNKSWGKCQGQPCQTLIVRIANKRTLEPTTPEVEHRDEINSTSHKQAQFRI